MTMKITRSRHRLFSVVLLGAGFILTPSFCACKSHPASHRADAVAEGEPQNGGTHLHSKGVATDDLENRENADCDWREGDIIFQSLPHGELVDAIEGVTQSEWSHCGVIMLEDGAWVVYEALGEVIYTPLAAWIKRGRGEKYVLYRLKPDIDLDVKKLRQALQSFLGKVYDYYYEPDDSAIYCSELVYKTYDRSEGIQLGVWETLGSLNWEPFEEFNRTSGMNMPLDNPMITPVGLTRSEFLVQVETAEWQCSLPWVESASAYGLWNRAVDLYFSLTQR